MTPVKHYTRVFIPVETITPRVDIALDVPPESQKPRKPRIARKQDKADPRPSLAPLDFEEALESLLAVKPPPDPAENPSSEQ